MIVAYLMMEQDGQVARLDNQLYLSLTNSLQGAYSVLPKLRPGKSSYLWVWVGSAVELEQFNQLHIRNFLNFSPNVLSELRWLECFPVSVFEIVRKWWRMMDPALFCELGPYFLFVLNISSWPPTYCLFFTMVVGAHLNWSDNSCWDRLR